MKDDLLINDTIKEVDKLLLDFDYYILSKDLID